MDEHALGWAKIPQVEGNDASQFVHAANDNLAILILFRRCHFDLAFAVFFDFFSRSFLSCK